MADEQLETFDTGGRVLGYVGIAAAVGLAALYLGHVRDPDPFPLPLLTGSLFAAVLFWAAIVRPRVRASSETLVLVNVLETVRIPFAAVEDHVLRQVLAVRAGGRKWVATGIGRTRKASAGGVKALRARALGDAGSSRGLGGITGIGNLSIGGLSGAGSAGGERVDAADFAETRIGDLAREARVRERVERLSEEQRALGQGIVREPAWPVIAALAVTLVAFVVTLFL